MVLPLELPAFFPNSLSMIVGNTKMIWPHFIEHVKSNPNCVERKDPFDEFVEETVRDCLNAFLTNHTQNTTCSIQFAHRTYQTVIGYERELRYLGMQTMASLSGLAHFHQPAYLCIHPEYGPWFAMRAVITFHCISPSDILDISPSSITLPTHPPISSRLEEAILKAAKVAKTNHDWIHIRKLICKENPTWSKWEYDLDQLNFHYFHDKSCLNN